jgi:hypothetical protein
VSLNLEMQLQSRLSFVSHFLLSALITLAPRVTLADAFQLKPVFEFDTSDQVKSIDSMKGNDVVGPDGLIRQTADAETGACNQAIQLIGTYTNQNIKATVCRSSSAAIDRKCQQRIFHSVKIVGGTIFRVADGGSQPVSQVNDLNNPGETKMRTCSSSVSWDPASDLNSKYLYQTERITNNGMTQTFPAGVLNPGRKGSGTSGSTVSN